MPKSHAVQDGSAASRDGDAGDGEGFSAAARTLLDVADREQRRIASDLHDGLQQVLVAAKMYAEAAIHEAQRG